MHTENLKLLAKGLKTLEPSQFDMSKFMDSCGTVGCVLGWSATFKGLEPIDSEYVYDDDDDEGRFSYYRYSVRVFETNPSQWHWCFSHRWASVDNTVEGAIKRINYLIDNDGAPENFWCVYQFKDEYNKMFYSKNV